MNPLRLLTARGLALLCAGAALLVAGYLLGQREFVALGTLALSLPSLAWLTVAWAPRSVTHSRELQPTRVSAGTDTRVLLRIVNSSALPIGGLLAEDTLPFSLGQDPRFAVGYLRPQRVADLSYRLRPHVRGSYRIGPLKLWSTDPLGCVRLRHPAGSPVPLLVTPTVVRLPEPPLQAGPDRSGEEPARSAGTGGDDVLPREYRHGDDLRRVHWRSTARYGRLMVRREEHQWRARSEVLLDTRAGAHAGAGPDSSLETGVSAAASIALHLLGCGQEIRMVAGDREVPTHSARSLTDTLAVVEASETVSDSLHGTLGLLPLSATSGAGLFVAVLGALRPADTEALARARGTGGPRCVAVLCRRAAWPSPEALRRSRDALVRAGWAVLEIGSAEELSGQWPRLAVRPGVGEGPR